MAEVGGAPPKAQRRGLRWAVGTVAAVLFALGTLFRPHWTSLQVSSGHRYDVIQLSRDRGVARMFGPSMAELGEAILLNYYAVETGIAEARDVMELAKPAARQYRDSLIVVQQTQTPWSRWLPYVRGQMYAFRRNALGGWDTAP